MNETGQNANKRAAGVITTAAFVSIFIYSFVVSLPAVLINEVIEAFSLEGTDEGFMGAFASFGFMLSIFFVVLIQGRAQKSTVLIVAFLAQAIMLFICGFSPIFLILCIGCALVGFSGGFIDTFSNSSIVDIQKGESTKYLGILHGLFGVGSLLSPLIFIWVLRYVDWRGIHYALAITSTLVMLLIFILTRGMSKKTETIGVREHLFTKADLFGYIKVKRNAALALAGFFSMCAIACVLVWIVRYMTLRYNAAELGALSISVYWVCSTINRFFLVQHVKRAPMKLFSLGALLSSVFILVGVFSGSPIILCVMIGFFGLCSGHFVPVLVSESAVGYEGRTTFTTSFIMFVMSLGRIIAPVMMAFTSTQISLTVSMMLPVVAILATACCGFYAAKKC